MPIIESVALRKVYRSIRRRPGLGGALGALFSREYEEKVAVDGVDFALEPGELVGYLGPNGAGKSTTIKMLTGILVPTSGTLRVAGLVPFAKRQENAQNIGVVFGQRSQLYWDLPLRESFELLRSIYDVPRDRYLQNLRHFTEILDLEPFMATPVRQLSLGERMRGDFAGAMLHDPKIVYLDEPTIGLDVVAKEAIRVFIEERQSRTRHDRHTHDARSRRRRAAYEARRAHRRRNRYLRWRARTITRRIWHVSHARRDARRQLCEDVDVAGAIVASRGKANVVRYRFNRRELSAEAHDQARHGNLSHQRRCDRRTRYRCDRAPHLRRRLYALGARRRRRDRSSARPFRIEPYVEFAKRAMAREATYRFDVFTSIASVVVRVYLLRMVWTALYARNVGAARVCRYMRSSRIRRSRSSWGSCSTSIKRARCTKSFTTEASRPTS